MYSGALRKLSTKSISATIRLYGSMAEASISELAKKSLELTENNGFVLKSPYEPYSIQNITIDQYIWKNMSKWQDHVAIVCGTSRRQYTYAELRDHCAALAIRMRSDLKLEKNDIVAICLPNMPEYAIALLGSIEAALTITTVNPWYTAEEISKQLISSRPKAIFTLADNCDVVKKACSLAQQSDIKVIALKNRQEQTIGLDLINFNELISITGLNLSESTQFNRDVSYESLTILPYSSGTTGLPKGVMLTHNNLISSCELLNVKLPTDRLVLPTTNNYQDILPCYLPFFHAYGLTALLLSKLALGCKLVTMTKYDVGDFMRILKDYKATLLHVVPPTITQLNTHEAAKPDHFEHVRIVMSAASSLTHTDGERFRQIFRNCSLLQGFGMTETSTYSTISPQNLDNFSTIGWPCSSIEVKIADLNDSTFKGLPEHKTGEILIRGPNIMKGYFKNDEATNATITKDGWLRSGDIGYFDKNRLIYIKDRLKELIKVNAFQVAPAELEGILREHRDVLDAAVIGIPDEKCGEIPKAFVVRRPRSCISEIELQKFVAQRVIRYKHLSGGIHFVEGIPKSATGKILRREIRRMFLQA